MNNTWIVTDSKLVKEFVFKDFSEALAFIVRVGLVAEQLDHHPEMYNIYNKVKLSLWTHTSQSITEKDHIFAQKIDLIKT